MSSATVPTDRDVRISGLAFAARMARKLASPGVLPSLIKVRRLSDDTQDSFGGQLQRTAAAHPDRPALIAEGRTWTWAQVNDESNRYAHALKGQGLSKGDVVALDMQNRPEMVFALMGMLKLGVVAALQNTSLRGEVLAHSISLVSPKALIVGGEQLEEIESMPEPAKAYADLLLFIPDGDQGVPEGFQDLTGMAAGAASHNPPEVADVGFGDPCVYIYTSGTTGMPKAAVQPHRRLFLGGLFSGRALRELKPTDVVYNPLPMYHSNGLLGGWAGSVFTGAAMAPVRKFSASTFWDDCREVGATSFIYIGELLRYLLNQPPSPTDRQHSVTMASGAGLRAESWHEFKRRFGIDTIYEVYGASESPSGFMNLLNFDRTCGWMPIGWTAIAWDADEQEPVRGADGRCVEVAVGDVGLLIMEIGEHQHFDGYTDPEATEQKILTDVLEPGDRWFNTHDLVLRQGFGHMRFIDRTGDTFRWNSENVATTQVESVINTWPQIDDAVVYGVEVPGAEGRCGMARLVLKPGEELDTAGFAAHLRKDLAKYAIPRFLRIAASDAEVTGTFKHRKGDLKDAGYDPAGIDEPVLFMAPADDAYAPLTAETVAGIAAGTVRL